MPLFRFLNKIELLFITVTCKYHIQKFSLFGLLGGNQTWSVELRDDGSLDAFRQTLLHAYTFTITIIITDLTKIRLNQTLIIVVIVNLTQKSQLVCFFHGKFTL